MKEWTVGIVVVIAWLAFVWLLPLQTIHYETTYQFDPPRDGCLIASEGWWNVTTKKGNTGIFLWECTQP